MFKMVLTLSSSVLINFQGSSSARYLLPKRARSIAFFSASRKRKLSRLFSTSALIAEIEASEDVLNLQEAKLRELTAQLVLPTAPGIGATANASAVLQTA